MTINDRIVAHLGLARACAVRHWRRWGGDLDEWHATAAYWLVRLAHGWRPGGDFQAYIATYLPRRLLNVSTNRIKPPPMVPLDANADAVDRRYPDPAHAAELRDEVAALLSRLDWRERHVIRQCELRGRTGVAVARQMGVDQATVNVARQRAMRRLSQAMKNEAPGVAAS